MSICKWKAAASDVMDAFRRELGAEHAGVASLEFILVMTVTERVADSVDRVTDYVTNNTVSQNHHTDGLREFGDGYDGLTQDDVSNFRGFAGADALR